MDFYESLVSMDEATITAQTLKNPAVSAAIDKKNAELNKKGKQVHVDPKTGRLNITNYDRNAANAVSIINKIK